MRKIQPGLELAIENACKGYEDYHFAIKQGLWRPLMTIAAKPFVDVSEHGENKGEIIEMLQKTVDGKAQGEPYCLAFVMTVLAFVEKKLNMVSMLKSTEGCLDLWNTTSPHLKTTRFPLPGYIAIWQHGNTSKGHAGLVLRVTDYYFKTIEANSWSPDGKSQGIHTHERLFDGDGSMKLLGFICPF